MPALPIARLLIVDDEAAQMKALHDTLEAEGYSAVGFTSASAALAELRDSPFDLVLTDLMMPEMDGVAFLRAAFEIDPTLTGIVMTGHGAVDTAVQAMQAGALDYILKPFRLSAILPVLTRALEVRRVRMENIELHQAVGMYELSKAIGFALDFDTVLQKVADAALAQSRVRAVSVLLPGGPGGAELQVAAARGENAESVLGMRASLAEPLSDWLVRSHAQDEPAAALSGLSGIPGNVSIPMLAAGSLIGILHFSLDRPHRPVAPGQLKALNILAGAAASALDAASLIEKVRAADRQYLRLAENAADIILRYDLYPEPRLAYVNRAFLPITGYLPEECYADSNLLLKIVHPDDRAAMETVLRGGYPNGASVGIRCVHRNGTAVWMELRVMHVRDFEDRLIAIEAVARDVTDRRKLEEQLRQSQKMEAIGLLAGGVAHDFNNLLTIILGYSNLILADDTIAVSIREQIDQMKRAGESAAAMTRQLLAFGRRQVVQPRLLDINTVVESTLKLLRRVIGEDIELAFTPTARLGYVKVDPDQVEQILMNLAVNARDAMPQGGTLSITTGDVNLDDTCEFLQGAPGRYAMLAVRDTGCGMDAATQSRIFEPYFTTKEPGKGTGLGLSIVYGAVKQNGGSISVESAPGEGTTFRIYLPHNADAVSAPEAPITQAKLAPGSETILVVDDHASVRRLIATFLRKGGYEVLEAQEGNEALEICRRDGEKVRLVLTDMVMPKLGGTELAEKLREVNPGIRVLFMSGYPGGAAVRDGYLDPGVPFVRKPFSSDSLLTAVREALDRNASGDAVMSAGG